MFWHDAGGSGESTVDEVMLRRIYAHPGVPSGWVRSNFVASVSGAIAVEGRSAGLGNPTDRQVFSTLRELADVVLVGAGTVRAEDYGGVELTDQGRARRLAAGRPQAPVVAVVSDSARLDPTARLFSTGTVAPMVIVPSTADADAVRACAQAGAQIVTAGTDKVDMDIAISEIVRLVGPRVLCEGGPALHTAVLEAGLLDELCLTISPLITGVAPGAILDERFGAVEKVALESAVHNDGVLLLRYRTERGQRRARS